MPASASPRRRRTQAERTETTVGQLTGAARALFAADGYGATSLEAVSEKAGVTKGALYHHFSGKPDLFRAVFELEQRRLADAVRAAAGRRSEPWTALRDGCRAFFEASLDPGVQRITLLDAPAVLGWEALRAIEREHSFALLQDGLRAAIRHGVIARRPVDPLAHLLHGAMCEGAMMVARSEDQRAATRQVLRELRHLLDGLARDRG